MESELAQKIVQGLRNEDLAEHNYRFVRYLERTEGKRIFLGRG